MKLGMIVYNDELQIKFEFRCYWSIFAWVIALGLRIFMKISVFRTYFGLFFQILKWNLVWLFTMMSYRSSLSFVVIDQYLTELWALGLWIFMKFSVFRTFFGLIFQILKWNWVWLLTMMSYRSSLSFVVIDEYLTELWALGLWIFMKFSVFRTFFGLIFQILKWNWVWLLTMMSYRSSLSFVVIDEYLTELWTLGHKIFMKISVYGTLYNYHFTEKPFRLKHILSISCTAVLQNIRFCILINRPED